MKEIENRGRTLDAVVNPKNYAPFSKITDSEAFDAAWKSNPDWIFANMAHAAYCDRKYLEKRFKDFGATVKFYESKPDPNGIIRGREAFLAVWADKAILSFRGTEADDKLKIKIDEKIRFFATHLKIDLPSEVDILFLPTDLIDDLSFAPFTYREENGASQVHGGFFKATMELWPDISNDLEGLSLSDPAQLYATGHSLGAAMAVIAGIRYSFKKIVTFGEPSVGNNLDNTIEPGCSHIRYVNGDDPVTKIVPESLFKHHGELKEIRDSEGPDFRFDHSIINYAVILESMGMN
jgi:hypothetical protein